MSKVLLTAYALPIKKHFGITHHTYVAAEDGRKWPCFGQCDGGRVLVKGYGDGDLADRYGLHDSQAGLFYGVTGVCHQATNRILASSGRILSLAPQLLCASFAYGHYGLQWDVEGFGCEKPDWVENWQDRRKRCKDPDAKDLPKPPAKIHKLMQARKYAAVLRKTLKRIEAGRKAGPLSQDEIIDGLETEITLQMYYTMTPKEVRQAREAVLDEAGQLYKDKAVLIKQFMHQEVTGAGFADRMNRRFLDALKSVKKRITAANFVNLFGIGYSREIELVDPEKANLPPENPPANLPE